MMYAGILGLACLFFLVLTWFRLFNKSAYNGKVEYDFPFFMGMGWLLYSFFYTLEKVLRDDVRNSDLEFTFDCVGAILFLCIGGWIAHVLLLNVLKVKRFDFSSSNQGSSNIDYGTVIIMSIFIFASLNFYVIKVFGGWGTYFTQVYGEYLETGINSLTVLIPLLCVSYILVFNSSFIFLFRPKVKKMIFICSLSLIAVFFMGGNRNLAMMMVIALTWTRLYNKKVNVFYVFPIIIVGMVVSAVNAVGRMYGFANFISGNVTLEKGDITRFILAVSEGEFGTMARVSKYFDEFNFNYHSHFGYSYIIDPIVNLIPSYLYPDRPNTMAVEFTKQYWGGLETGTIGLGFSPIVEAKINFYGAWLIVFLGFGFVIKLLKIIAQNSKRKVNDYLLFGALSSISLNFFRIDFAITIKFFAIVYVFCYVLIYFTKVMNRLRFN